MAKLVEIDKINPSAYNPRKADPERLDMLELSLRKLGFLHPVYADANGEILSGHQRQHVARRMGVKSVPVEYVKAMPLSKRKAYNIAFNRGTNDLARADTSSSITEALNQLDIKKMAEALPDIEVNTPEFYPCLHTQFYDVQELAKKNLGKMNEYTKNMARMLAQIGVEMPIVISEDGEVVNGIGRLNRYAELGKKVCKVVVLPKDRAEFARAMLNYISMEFDIQTRYADTLRHNSFMRSRNTRGGGLGDGFYKGIFPTRIGSEFNPLAGKDLDKWIDRYGTCVVDFGAGKLSNTKILRDTGKITVSAFEPYFLASGEEISKKHSIQINLQFLEEIEAGREFDTIFICSVFNSVPFMQDRKYIATICSALCSEHTKLVCWTQGENAAQNTKITADRLSKTDAASLTFRLDYEPNIALGDFSKTPKVQKFHARDEMIEIFSPVFEEIPVLKTINSFWYLEARGPKLNIDALREAIEFEFDLPYPDGTRMGLVDRAKEAFSKRLGVEL